MSASVNFGDTQVLTVVRAVLLGLLPPGIEVIRAYGNRVPEPLGPDFCVLSPPLRRDRLSTNRDTDTDQSVIGGIAGETLVVTAGAALLPGYPLYGPAVVAGSFVTAVAADGLSYTVTPPQSAPAGSTIYVGRHAMVQPTDLVCQCDVHGPNSSGNASILAITWRDDAACQLIEAAAGPLEMQPLYADDPRLVPFQNAEAQWEDRWVVDLHLQANIAVSLGQQFAASLRVGLFPVDLRLPTPVTPTVPVGAVGLEDGSGAWAFEDGTLMEWG
jgi:hypothetical protein